MSGIKPLFSTAPRVKIRIGGETVAFAVGFSFNVGVNYQPVYELGSFGPVSIEPVSYAGVTGSIQIQKILSKAARVDRGVSVSNLPEGTTDNNSILSQANNNLALHLDPEQVLLSSTFDLEIYMKYALAVVVDPNKPHGEFIYLSVTDCRLTGRSSGVQAGALVGEAYNFSGLLYISSPSGLIKESMDTGVTDYSAKPK